jgi:hypothetical protein
MPHYKNGREVKVGDKIVGQNQYAGVFAGNVVAIYPGSSTGNISYIPTGTAMQSATTTDCLHESDAEITAATHLDTYDANNLGHPKPDV